MRLRVILLAFTISSLAMPVTNAANPAQGGSCTRIGTSKVSNGIKFTCIKSGKKLVWNKGVPIKTNKTVTLNNLENVWNEVAKLRSAKPIPSVALDIRYSPTLNKPYADKVLKGMTNAAQFWQDEFLPKAPMPVIVFSEKDKTWYKKQLEGLGISSETIGRKIDQFDAEASRTGSRMNWAGMNGDQGITWFEFSLGTDFGTSRMGSDAKLFELGNSKVGPHEYTHAAQWEVINSQNLDFTPCWFLEGGAEFYGMILGAKDLETLRQMRQQQVWEPYYLNFKGMAYEPSQGWEKFLEDNGEFKDGSKLSKECGPNGAYPVGSVATQYLFELKGQTGIVAFMSEINATQDWKKAIFSIYGISWEKLKKEIASYIRLIVSQTPKP